MIRNRFFDLVPGILFLAADKGGGSGSTVATIEEQLSSAKADLIKVNTQVDSLTKERDDANKKAGDLQAQFDSATKSATDAQAELKTVKGELETAKTTINNLTSERDDQSKNIVRLETLCGVKGVDPKSAVPPQSSDQAGGDHVYDQWQKATGAMKTRLFREHKAEIRAEGDRRKQAGK